MTVFVIVTLKEENSFEKSKQAFLNNEHIVHMWQATGDVDYVLEVEVDSTKELHSIVSDLDKLDDVKYCRAHVMLHNIK